MEAIGPDDRLDYVPIFHQCYGLDGALVYFAPSDWNDNSKAKILPFLL